MDWGECKLSCVVTKVLTTHAKLNVFFVFVCLIQLVKFSRSQFSMAIM